jgi:hypothetical protein
MTDDVCTCLHVVPYSFGNLRVLRESSRVGSATKVIIPHPSRQPLQFKPDKDLEALQPTIDRAPVAKTFARPSFCWLGASAPGHVSPGQPMLLPCYICLTALMK